MLHPFADEPLEEAEQKDAEPELRNARRDELLRGSDGISDIDFDHLQAGDQSDLKIFLEPINKILQPHLQSVAGIEEAILTDRLPPQMIEVVGRYRNQIVSAIEKIKKNFKIYVETAVDESLQKEAMRLERRYFQDKTSQEQQNFLKLKRFYEKIKTFSQSAKGSWREIKKIVDAFMVMNSTRSLAFRIEKDYLKKLIITIHQTDHFLDELKLFLKVEDEISDPITGSIKIQMDYDPGLSYTLAAMLGLEEKKEVAVVADEIKEKSSVKPRQSDGSIALNIVLETREHKLNRASLISVNILGSRDWNRTPDYKFEVPLAYFEECIEQFKKSYHVNISPDKIKNPVPTSAIGVARGVGEDIIVEYKNLIILIIDEIANDILDDDFPGLAHPEIFLYHCGCSVFYKIIIKYLKKRGLGEMLYVSDSHTSSREFPEELIQKILIDWWSNRFSTLQGEDVDSYLTYSRQLEMVKREYRILYEEGSQLIRKENPALNYMGVENQISKNLDRIFGLRKVEIFKRFVNSQILYH